MDRRYLSVAAAVLLSVILWPGEGYGQWSTAVLLNDPSEAGADIKEGKLIAAENGFHAVYRVTSNSRIRYRRYYNGSLKPVQDVFPATNFAANPYLGVALDGTVHVVFEDWAGNNPNIRWYRFTVDDNTGAISNVVTQVLTTDGGAKHPHITPYGLSGGQMLMTYYRSGTSSNNKQLHYRLYNGSTWGPELPIGSPANSEYECFGQARAPDGSVWRSFTDAGTLKLRRFDGNWGPEIVLDSNGQMHNRQRLAVNDSGQVMVVWDEDGKLWSMLHTPGVGNGPKIMITNENSWFQGMCAIRGTNHFQVGYPKNHDNVNLYPSRCYAKRWTGAAWQAEEVVTQGLPHAFTVQPELDCSPDGTVYCTFEYWGNGKPQRYFSMKSTGDGGPMGTISGTVTDQFGAPLVGASISVQAGNATSTGPGGTYSLQVPISTTSATASKTFYTPHTVSGFTVTQGQTTIVNFVLNGEPPADVTNLTATAGNTRVTLQWKNPGSANFTGVRVLARVGSAPNGVNDPEAVVVHDAPAAPGSTGGVTHEGLTNGQTYYYRAFAYYQDASRFYSSGSTPASATPALKVDFDRDGDVDQSDFAHMQVCLTGLNVPITNPACMNADLDPLPDNDVDTTDLNIFLGCFSGPNVYANPNCMP